MSAESEPIRIAFCITELDRGGAERALTRLVLGLDRRSWLPRVYCLGPRGHFADDLEAADVAVECFQARGILSFPAVLLRLTLSLRRFRPALLQTFLFHGNLVGRFAGRFAGVPRIVSGVRVAERRSSWYGLLDRWTNRLVDCNVCVSQGVAEFAIESTKLDPRKICVIPNGVDFLTFADAEPADPVALGLRPQDPIILCVGRLEPQKGLVDLIHAAPIVLRDFPHSQFVIVGGGPDRASLEALATSLGIARSIIFLGPRPDVPRLLKAASVFVLPSLWEGMPNALLEAMAAGLPVIATAVEGSRDVIHSGTNGLLVDPANPREVSGALLRLLRDSQLSAALAHEAQHTVKEQFTETGTIAAYDCLYRRLTTMQ